MNNSAPKVSIITPMHNDSSFVRQTIESVLSQTFNDWEMLIVDDNSSDGSLAVAKEYESKQIRVFHNEKNMGAAYSRNVALREARGDFIAFLDADDWWAPEKLEKQIRFMENLKIDFSCTAYYRCRLDGSRVITTAPYIIGKKVMRACDYVGCLTAMYRREKIGLIQVEPSIKKRNDYAIWLQVSKKANCYFLAEPLAYYRVREGSISHVPAFRLLRYHKHLFRKQMKYCWVHSWFCALRNGYFSMKKRKDYVVPEGTQLDQVFF